VIVVNSGAFKKGFIIVISAPTWCIMSFAAGFQLNQTSTSLQGSAMAGAAAASNDVSALFNNPATLMTLSETQVYLGASEFFPNVRMSEGFAVHKFNAPGLPPSSITAPVSGYTHENNVGRSAFIPNGYVGWHFADKFSAGVAITEPYYLSTHYSPSSLVRFVAVKNKINSVNINPVVAYQINERWSVGLGIQAQYLKTLFSNFNGIYTGIAEIDSLLATTRPSWMKSDGWNYGYTLGGLYQLNSKTRIGLSYRSQIATSLQGYGEQYLVPGDELVSTTAPTFLFNGETLVHTKIKTPGVLSFGVAHDVDAWTLKGTFQATFWNRMKVLRINTPNVFETQNQIFLKWRSTWLAAVGADYRYKPSWTVRGGFAFDQTPTRDTLRDPRIPDQDHFWLNFGLSYFLNQSLSIDGAYSHIFMNDKKVNLTQKNMKTPESTVEVNQVYAKYRGSEEVVSLALRYRC
jgi:long-chain fatty acid transport protein